MMRQIIEGIVISEINYSESSKILNVFTKEYGIIGVISKGCRNIKSQLRSVSQRLTYGMFNIYYKKDGLSTLTGVDIINDFEFIKMDISKISYASYILELSSQVYKESENSDIYDLCISALKRINEGYNMMAITNIIELKYLDYLGVKPSVDGCYKCGSKDDIVTISSSAGGYVCKKCYNNESIIDRKIIVLIRRLYYADLVNLKKIDINMEVLKGVGLFLDEYYDEYTGLYLKSKDFIKNLSKVGLLNEEV